MYDVCVYFPLDLHITSQEQNIVHPNSYIVHLPMVIAINTKHFLKAYQEDYSNFIYECFNIITREHPKDTFIFFFDTAFNPPFNFSENAMPLIIKPKINFPVLYDILYKMKIASLLKKYKANIFVNADGFCSLFTKIPHCFIVHHIVCLSNKGFRIKNRLFFYQKFISFFLKKTKVIVTDSEFSKNLITKKYKTDNQKIDVIHNGINDSTGPVKWEEKELIKDQYADRNEFFIFIGETSRHHKLFNLLKAFSHFKKWHKSGMQLLIVKRNSLSKNFTESLRLFKYRKDVKLLDNLPESELEKITTSAYAIIYFPECENPYTLFLKAIKSNVPVITNNSDYISEIFADAVLYVNPDDHNNIAEKLMIIFKDENIRQQLIEKGKKQTEIFSWDKTSNLLWQSIVKSSK